MGRVFEDNRAAKLQAIFGGLIRVQFEFKYPALNKPRQNIGCQNLVLKKSK